MINKVSSWPPVAINQRWFIRDDGFLDSFNSIFVLIPLLVICKSGSDRTVYSQVVFYIQRLVSNLFVSPEGGCSLSNLFVSPEGGLLLCWALFV